MTETSKQIEKWILFYCLTEKLERFKSNLYLIFKFSNFYTIYTIWRFLLLVQAYFEDRNRWFFPQNNVKVIR